MNPNPKIVAVVPCKDGGATVATTVSRLSRSPLVHEVVVVDDGSVDNTSAQAEAAGATVVRLGENRGKGAAMRAGVAAASDAEIFLFVDADTADTAGAALALLEPVMNGDADLTIGALPSAGGKGGFGTVKNFAVFGIRKACGFEARAPLSGQRAITANLLSRIRLADRFAVEVGMTIDAVRAGGRVQEIDVSMQHHHRGKTLGGFAHRGRQGIDVAKALWPRLLPAWVRWAIALLAIVALLAALILAPGTKYEAGTAIGSPESKVTVQLVPGWQWVSESVDVSSPDNPVAVGSINTGKVQDIERIVRSGSRNHEAEPLPEVEVKVETPETLANRDVLFSPPGTITITAGVTSPGHEPALRPIVVAGASTNGKLQSSSTRTDGLVDIVDIAPTVLRQKGLPIPASVQGAPIEIDSSAGGFSTTAAYDRNATAQFFRDLAPKVIATYVVLQVLVYLFALHKRRSGQSLSSLQNITLGFASLPLATYLVTAFSNDAQLSTFTWSARTAVAVGIIVFMSKVFGRFQPVQQQAASALRRILLATVGVMVFGLAFVPSIHEVGVFANAPLLGARYYGLGNPATTIILLAAILWSALHIKKSANQRNALLRSAVMLAVVLLAIGMPHLGADAGGLLGGLVAGVATLLLLSGRKISAARSALMIAAASLLTLCAAALDSMRSPDTQTHLGRTFSEGVPGIFDAVSRRADANVFGYGFPWSLAVVLVAGIVLIGLLRRHWTTMLPIDSPQRSGVLSAMVAAFLVYLLNDSGVVVLALAAVFVGPFIVAQQSGATNLEVLTQ